MSRSRLGFTLIELLVTLTVLAILLAVAAPSMAALRTRTSVVATHNLLLTGFAAARTHAVSFQHLTTICPGDSVNGCRSDGVWDGGWIVFVDADDNGRMDAGDHLVFAQGRLESGLHVSSGSGRPRATFRPNGTAGGANLTLRVCADGEVRSALILSNAGRTRSAGASELAGMPGCG